MQVPFGWCAFFLWFWDQRAVLFQLSGFYCRTLESEPTTKMTGVARELTNDQCSGPRFLIELWFQVPQIWE